MVKMTTIAGTTDYKIYLATATTGAAGSETPSGDVVYFYAEDYSKPVGNIVKPKPSVNFTAYYPASKWNLSFTLKNCHVKANVKSTATEEADAIDHFIFTHSIQRGGGGFYIFLYHEADAKYRHIDWNSTGVHMQSCFVAIDGWDDHAVQGKLIIYPSMKFIKAG